MSRLDDLIQSAPQDGLQRALHIFLDRHLTPAFAAAKAIDHELAAIEAMQIIGYLSAVPTEYEWMTRLRVTKAKARNLLYQWELRRVTEADELEGRVKAALSSPRLVKDGEKYLLEIDSPLVLEALRNRLRILHQVADSSFQPSLVKLSIEALAALIEHYIPESERPAVEKTLRKAKIPGSDLKSLLIAVIRKAGGKLADETGTIIAERIGDQAVTLLSDLMSGSTKVIRRWL